MGQDEKYIDLKPLGYRRINKRLADYSNKALINQDLSDALINHTILKSCTIVRTNFDKAAMTGSIFDNCKFLNCSMNVPDLEYCKFNECRFISSKQERLTASLNNSSFIASYFKNIAFYGCSFAESYFENCTFDNVEIEFTTLENSLFRNCTFKNMDLSNSNLQFVEFIQPSFINSKLPLFLLPYTIGGLQYCQETNDNLIIVSEKGDIIPREDFFTSIIPLLIQEYECTEDFFPLANIYITLQNYQKAIEILKKGLTVSVAVRDFRMIKFYCKLIVYAGVFNAHTLHDFYHLICRLIPQGNEKKSELHSYIKNIGEIKDILFSSSRRPILHVTFITNIFTNDVSKVAILIEKLFKIAKINNLNQSELRLSENSPLLIDMSISGSEEDILPLLPALISLTLENVDQGIAVVQHNICSMVKENKELSRRVEECKMHCGLLGITLSLAEYFLENCTSSFLDSGSLYFYNGNLKRNNLLN